MVLSLTVLKRLRGLAFAHREVTIAPGWNSGFEWLGNQLFHHGPEATRLPFNSDVSSIRTIMEIAISLKDLRVV
jgi:hypothetical protein